MSWLVAAKLASEHQTGLAPYYPFLYACVLGLKAKQVLEFGSGLSSRVLVDALHRTGGQLLSIDPHPKTAPMLGEPWEVWARCSEDVRELMPSLPPLDLVLHDGAHSAAVVRDDLLAVLPRMRNGGLILIHDTLHSYVGPAMQEGLTQALEALPFAGDHIGRLTLPFAFGLTIWQVSRNGLGTVVSIGLDKPSSLHHTMEAV